MTVYPYASDMDQARRIAEARKAKGLTQKQVADTLKVSVQAVSQWETGKSAPKNFLLLATILGTSVDWLLGGGDPPPDKYLLKELDGNHPIYVLSVEGMFMFASFVQVPFMDVANEFRDIALHGATVAYTQVPPVGLYYATVSTWSDEKLAIREGDLLIFDKGYPIREGDRVHYIMLNKPSELDIGEAVDLKKMGDFGQYYSQGIDFYDESIFKGSELVSGSAMLRWGKRLVLGALVEQRSFAPKRPPGGER